MHCLTSILPPSEDLYGAVPTWADPDVLDLDAQEVLNELDIGLTIRRKSGKGRTCRNVGLPTWEAFVDHLDLSKTIQVGWVYLSFCYGMGLIELTRESLNLDPIDLISHGHLDLLEPIQNVQFRQVETRVPIDHG